MSNPDALAYILGIILPLVATMIKQAAWPGMAKVALAWGLAIAAGIGTAYVSGQLTPGQALVDIAVVLGLSQTIYATFFERLEKEMGWRRE